MNTHYQLAIATNDPATETWHNAADLGIEEITRTRLSAATDTLTLTLTSPTALTDTPLWAYNTLLRLRRVQGATTTLIFTGRVQPYARAATGLDERTTITIHGPWHDLDRTPLLQTWTMPDSTTHAAPRVNLFAASPTTRRTTGQQIAHCITQAIAAGAHIAPPAPGDIATGFTPPIDEQTNITIAQAIIICLSNHPHAVCWFDYTERTPRFHVATRQSLPSTTLDITQTHEHINITPRNDLQPPAVAICYQKPMTDGDQQWLHTTIDSAPPSANLSQIGTLWGVFDLSGLNAQYDDKSQAIKTESIDWDTNKTTPAWWRSKCPDLANTTIHSITNPLGQYSYPNFLISGTIQDWMRVEHKQETFTADALISTSNTQGIAQKKVVKISFTAISTNAVTKTYRTRTLTSLDTGDTIPTNIATTMYAEWQQLHHDGTLTIVQPEAPLDHGPGHTLNLTGGRPEWTTMAALITRTTEQLYTGATTIEFGVPPWIDLATRVAWYRNCRNRRFSLTRNLTQPEAIPEPDPTDPTGGTLALPGITSGAEATTWLRQRFIDPTATTKHEIDINLADITDTTLRTLKIREVQIIVNDSGTLKAQTALILCSTPYGDKEAIGGGHFDLRYDTTTGQLQKQTEPDGAWTMITGGQTVEETV